MNILLVDDSKTAIKDLEIALLQIGPSFNILACQNFDDAMEILSTNPIDIAFIDLQIPEKNGADLIMEMKSSKLLKNIRVVIVTGTGKKSLLKTSLLNTVEAYLHKPVNVSELEKLLL